jgi:hypothetical protein
MILTVLLERLLRFRAANIVFIAFYLLILQL